MHLSFLDSIINYIHGDGLVILPQMELLLFALGILIFDFLLDKKEKEWNAILALVGVAAGGAGLYMQYQKYTVQRASPFGVPGLLGFHNTVLIDGFSLVFSCIFLAATGLVVLLSVRYLNIEEEQEGEYYALLLLACIGMMFMASGTDLIVLFLGLETMALSFYVLSGYLRHEKRSNEAALKYLLLGAFSTGILAYGFSLLYG
jgi:NADH-quinone oxidoreductase subunit N